MPRPLLDERRSGGFADWLDGILSAQKVSPTVLAARAGVSEAYVSLLRNGRRQPSYKAVVRLARALGQANDLPHLLDLAGLPSVVPVHRSGPRRSRNGSMPLDVISPARGMAERRDDPDVPSVERWELLVGMGKMIDGNRDWRVRRQAGLMLSGMARMIGGHAIEFAKATLADALQREKNRDARHTFEQAASMLDQAATGSGRDEAGERAQAGNALCDLVKQSARA